MTILISKARANTELLSEMLVSSDGVPDEFEVQLTSDLTTEVRELRDLFTAYIKMLEGLDGPDAEQLMAQVGRV